MSRLVVMDLDETVLRVMKELKDHPTLETEVMILKQPVPTTSERGAAAAAGGTGRTIGYPLEIEEHNAVMLHKSSKELFSKQPNQVIMANAVLHTGIAGFLSDDEFGEEDVTQSRVIGELNKCYLKVQRQAQGLCDSKVVYEVMNCIMVAFILYHAAKVTFAEKMRALKDLEPFETFEKDKLAVIAGSPAVLPLYACIEQEEELTKAIAHFSKPPEKEKSSDKEKESSSAYLMDFPSEEHATPGEVLVQLGNLKSMELGCKKMGKLTKAVAKHDTLRTRLSTYISVGQQTPGWAAKTQEQMFDGFVDLMLKELNKPESMKKALRALEKCTQGSKQVGKE